MSKKVPKTFVFGADGFIGRKLFSFYKNQHIDTQGTTRHKSSSDLLFFDLADFDFSSLAVHWKDYQQAIFCFGKTQLSYCENHKNETYKINVSSLLDLAEKMHQQKIKPIFFSSDLVFDGTNQDADDKTPTHPLNEYGRQKSLLEKELPKICADNYLIVRLSKVYNSTEKDRSLIFDILEQFLTQPIIYAADDYFFSPIALSDVIKAIILLQENNSSGLFNLAGEELISWYDLCCLIARFFGFSKSKIQAVKIKDLNPNIKRPSKIRLLPDRFKKAFPHFQFSSLEEHLNQIKTLNLLEVKK